MDINNIEIMSNAGGTVTAIIIAEGGKAQDDMIKILVAAHNWFVSADLPEPAVLTDLIASV